MIAGVWFGTTIANIKRRIERVNAEQASIRGAIDIALADRAAAINELRKEITEFEVLKQQI